MINTKASIIPYGRIYCVKLDKSIVGVGDRLQCSALKKELNASKKKRILVKKVMK